MPEKCLSSYQGCRCTQNAIKDGYCVSHQDLSEEEEIFNLRAGERCRELGIKPEDIQMPERRESNDVDRRGGGG